METVTRTVRFKKQDLERIEKFLAENPIFDFSNLVRISIDTFIRQPKVSLKPFSEGQEHRVHSEKEAKNV